MTTKIPKSKAKTEQHLALAAFHLYMAIKPEDGLPMDLLTSGQRDTYRQKIRMAARSFDVTAVRAAQERGANGILAHAGLTLRDCSLRGRGANRTQAHDCIRAYDDQLTNGTEESDALYLQLQAEEQRDEINAKHVKALIEDEAEMVNTQARRDLQRDDRERVTR